MRNDQTQTSKWSYRWVSEDCILFFHASEKENFLFPIEDMVRYIENHEQRPHIQIPVSVMREALEERFGYARHAA